MQEIILIKYGEIILKGLNRHIFEDRLVSNIRKAVGDGARVYKSRATIYAEPQEGADVDALIQKILHVFGIVYAVRAAVCEKDLKTIGEKVLSYINLTGKKTFKVETKRADKTFPLKSPEISAEIGGIILEKYPHLAVDVRNPEITVNVEIREAGAYIYADKIRGQGGMPTGSAGKVMLLLSGGIDSPVAGYMMARRGTVMDAVHFFSPPFTSEKAKEKVLDLARILARYTGGMRVHIVPFTKQQLQMKAKCPAEHLTILMRRMMMQIACRIAAESGAGAVVTGESLGQVASQTLEAIGVTDACATMPCFRPLIGMDKEDIIAVARRIGSFETSILPYEDCCTIFVPKHPTTKPRIEKILESEALIDVEGLIQKAIEETVHIDV
ncbi:MAG: tRNA 4-thiouridine(8) synthase ThiI [Ruminococcaceae bacterium]|nr:tRNA 4-thiouridine(8) synthase ThiI [Oscillospiraceae bacterium]